MGSTCCRMQSSLDDDELLLTTAASNDTMSVCCCFRRSQIGANVDSSTTPQQQRKTATSCKACKQSLSIFRRHKCADCTEMHCADCLSLSADAPPSVTSSRTQSPRRKLCHKCGALSSGACTSVDLMTYTVHELRQYLERLEVSECNCTEKADLVELIIRINVERGVTSVEENADHRRHVEMLRIRMLEDNEMITPTHHATSNNGRGHISTPTTTTPPPPSNELLGGNPVVTSSHGEVIRTSSLRLPHHVQQSVDVDEKEIDTETRKEPFKDDMSSSTTELILGDDVIKETSTNVKPLSNVDRLTMIDRVDEMSVEQLSDILVRNGVNVEHDQAEDKVSLVLAVRRLQLERSRVSSQQPGIKPLPLCRLCACSPIDCVILDCGHMVTCTGCAQKLRECPVCQQFVVRTVHVFRA